MLFIYNLSIFFFGALWGSFFYTLSLRYINGTIKKNPLKALFSSSKCQECKSRINPVFLIPIIGFILLRGKCKKCGGKISLQYPIFEIIYGLLLIMIIFEYGIGLYSINIFILIGIAVAISIIDAKTFIIPDSLVIGFAILSIYPIILHQPFKDNIFGFLLMFLFFIIILLVFPGSFGGGDVKFASAAGLFSGLELSIVILETALVSGAIVGIIYAIKTKKNLRTKIPFGPFITLGIIVASLYGRDIILLYYRMMY